MSAEFDLWSKESLVLFAREANERVLQQKAEIEALRADLRAAIDAYRALVTSPRLSSSRTSADPRSPASR